MVNSDSYLKTLEGVKGLRFLPRHEQAIWLRYYINTISDVAKPTKLRDAVLMKLWDSYAHLMWEWEKSTIDFHRAQMERAQQCNMILTRLGEDGDKWVVDHTSTTY